MAFALNYPLFIAFGTLPSLLWLLFYLRQDDHPEPKRTILKVFFWGMLATIPALPLEYFVRWMSKTISLPKELALFFYIFAGIALVEEILKFLVVRFTVYSNKELDEPVDLMMYMITAALGFSALENIFVLFNLSQTAAVGTIATLAFVRFLGATFLHALSSGIFGFFLALSFANFKKHSWYVASGLGIAVLLHGFFNMTIIKAQGASRFWGPLAIFILLILFISFAISRLKRMKSVCNI